MDDYYDDEDDYGRREELEKKLFAMKEMLKQLNEAQDSQDGPGSYPRGDFRGGRGPRGGRGGVGRGRRGYQGRGRGYQDGRGRGMGRPPAYIPPLMPPHEYEALNSRQEEGYRDFYRGRGEGYPGFYRGRGEGYPCFQGSPGFHRGRGEGSQSFYRGQGEGYGGLYRGRGECYQNSYRGREHSSSPHRFESEHSYSETDDQHPRSPRQVHGIRPQFLAETLADYPYFSCSLLQLLEQRNMKPDIVRDVAFNHPYVFDIKDEIIELRPQIRICSSHCGPQGCENPSSCKDLHICDNYVLNFCYDKNCVLGHRWRTGHNDPVLRPLLIDRLPFPTLRKLVQLAEDHDSGSSDPLDVCRVYNESGCNQRNCASLHLCISFVTGLTRCKVSECQLNHDLLSPSCRQLLERHGIPTNEAPRDILIELVTGNPLLNNEEEHKPSQKQKSKGSQKNRNEEKPITEKSAENLKGDSRKPHNRKVKNTTKNYSTRKDSENSSDTESGSSSDTNDDSHQVPKKETKKSDIIIEKVEPIKVESVKLNNSAKENPNPVKPLPRRTLWSHYLQGDIPIPEICYYSVERSCKNEGSGCQKLHATKHFHWQVFSDQGTRWLNLRPEQVVCLEYAYCDPAKYSADLPKLDPATLEHSVSGLFILMGRENWQADFRTMVLSNASKSQVLKIRRLCTETIDGVKVKPATYVWYFSDKNGTWVQYGNVDTAGASHLVSNIKSSDIEKQFLQDPTSSLPFKNSKFSYLLDFKTMTQMNLSTRMSRQVIRRPVPHIQEEKDEEEKKRASVDLPASWQRMQQEERVCLVSLAPSSTEYTKVIGLLSGNHSLSGCILKIERIQNPYLWRAFENKVKEMMAVYKDASIVNVRQLFHGTTDNIVHNICSENFDWRLHGIKSGQSYGRGSYFAVDADYSFNYTQPDSKGLRYMFIARVAVGTTTRGNSQMVRPPMNPATSVLFDSTVDSVSSPRIIVKYDKQEYYPEYLLSIA